MKKKTKPIKVIAFMSIAVIVFILIFVLISCITVKASGFVNEDINFINLYSRYYLDNYQLDFYVDTSWSWLPWNWMDGIGRSVMYGLYCITDGIWTLSRIISCATGEAVAESYRLDFISDLADSIGKNMQTLAGISPSGFSPQGFYSGFLMLVILVVGCYVVYVGLIKRESSKAVGAVINMLVIFIVTTGFIAYAPQYIKNINEFSSDISTGALTLGTSFTMPGSVTGGEDSVDRIRDNLFSIQIYQPWLILQYGTTDVDASRIENLLSASPESEYGATREAVVIEEIEGYGNTNMTITKTVSRLGSVLLIFIINLLISIFVLLLSGMMTLSQLLFIIYAMFLPVSFVLAMFPTYGGMAKKAVMKVFNIIMMRAGLTLIVTVAFCVSGMIYSIASEYSFFMVAYLQVVVFAGIFMKTGDLLGMFSLQDDGSGKLQKGMFWNYLTTMVVRDKVNDMRYARKLGKRNARLQRAKARETWFENRVVSQTERREQRQQQKQQQSEQTPEVHNRRYRVAEDSPGLAWHMNNDRTASTEMRMDVNSESMKRYHGVESLRRKMYGTKEEDNIRSAPRWHYKPAEKSPELRWHVKDGEAVTEMKLNGKGESFNKYRGKEALKRQLNKNRVKETIEPDQTIFQSKQQKEQKEKMTGWNKDKKYRTARRTPGIAPQIDGNTVSTGMKIDAEGKSFERYHGKEALKRNLNSPHENTALQTVNERGDDRHNRMTSFEDKRGLRVREVTASHVSKREPLYIEGTHTVQERTHSQPDKDRRSIFVEKKEKESNAERLRNRTNDAQKDKNGRDKG